LLSTVQQPLSLLPLRLGRSQLVPLPQARKQTADEEADDEADETEQGVEVHRILP